MNEVIREFLIETNENLAQLDVDLVTLEKDPTERETLGRVFRTLHTVKGTAGFLGLQKLQAVAHAAESLLSQLRAGELVFNPPIASALLKVVDAVRTMLESVERSETDGDGDFSALIETLDRLRVAAPVVSPPMVTPAAKQPPTPVMTAVPEIRPPAPPSSGPPSLVMTQSSLHDAAESRAPAIADTSIRVDVNLLDKLMTLVGELVLARNQIMQYSASQEDTPFVRTVQRLNLLTTELQAGVMKTRMQPIGTIWSKFPRVVRDLAVACAKQVHIDLEGQETELDKTIIEAIRDPLTHLVRNAIDHGIEPPRERLARGKAEEGRLALRAFHEGGKVIIEINDDGAGIDPQRIRAKAIKAKLVTPEQADRLSSRDLVNLIFLPGFSTADQVTQFSGRGVGMDVVRTNIERIGGSVTIDSRPGIGATVRMKIPLTLAIIPALTITSAGERYAIPQVSLLELVRLEGESKQRGIEQIQGTPVYRLRGNLLPLVYLERALRADNAPANGHKKRNGADPADDAQAATNIVVLQADDRQFGLVVDAIHDTEEIVVKPLQKQLKDLRAFAGATIMGDGRVALILDVLGLAQAANVISGVRERALSEKAAAAAEPTGDRQTVLLFANSDGSRGAIPLSQVARLEEFPRSALERLGLLEMVQYRDEILPLIHVSRALRQRPPSKNGRSNAWRSSDESLATTAGDPIQVVVYSGAGRQVGLVVDRIVDIVEETLVSRSDAHRRGVMFTAVIQGRATEFLDVEAILTSLDAELVEPPHTITTQA
ncbi:MAG TPA: chemotaxis protein CheA [Planctomycetaceae bacterium]|jgi:two-component system chemotaxis sensor kinase CheA|nr:chemotaxis protein CheA [Planctomycetaceae bacterium]